jgi:uncharacterized protein (TIGR02270 family)
MPTTEPKFMWDVVEEHLDEAAFLSSQWERALVSPKLALSSIANGVEERLRAHVDGLLTAGAPARERLLEPALASKDRTVAFAAALAMLESSGREGFDAVVQRLDEAGPEGNAPFVRSLELARRADVDGELLALAGSGSPRRVGPALDTLAFRRVPVPADLLLSASAMKMPAVLPPALRAARLAGPKALPLVHRSLSSPVPEAREAALESGLVLGLRSAWAACRETVEAREPGSAFALLGLGLGGEASDVDLIARAAAEKSLRHAALFALGFTGRAAAADACLTHLRDENVARLAAEAFSAITGLAIEGEFRAPEPPPREEPIPLEEEDLDANLVPGPEAALPLPAAGAVEAWWKSSRAKFDPRARFVGGKAYDAAAGLAAFVEGPMRRRHALGLELAIRSKGEYALQTRGWAADQIQFQSEHTVGPRIDFSLPFGKLMHD